MKRLVYILVLAMLVSGIAVAQASAEKENVCHITGNGTYRLISVAAEAVPAHLAHGDALPGDTVGDSYPGQYDSTVTPVVGNDCSTVLRVVSPQMFYGPGGWGGWSCLETGYPQVVGGGYLPETATVLASGAAEPGSTVGGFTYPEWPHYTFPPGETGWVVQGAGIDNPTNIVVLCGQ